MQMDRIHVNNGTYFLNGDFTEKKEFCLNRLPVKYEMKEAKPERWLKFLSELLEEDDIPTLQEYMGNKKRIEQVDKSRELYYNTVTDRKWGERRNYDLMINSGNIGIEAASSLIVSIR